MSLFIRKILKITVNSRLEQMADIGRYVIGEFGVKVIERDGHYFDI